MFPFASRVGRLTERSLQNAVNLQECLQSYLNAFVPESASVAQCQLSDTLSWILVTGPEVGLPVGLLK